MTSTSTANRLVLPLRGIVPPMVTPLLAPETLDGPGLIRLLDRMLQGGVAGVFALGTTGEGTSFSLPFRKRVIQTACQWSNGRLPILVSVTDSAFIHAVELSRFAAECGAAAAVIAPPLIMPKDGSDLIEYLGQLAEQCPLPLFLYSMPPLTRSVVDPDVMRWAAGNPKFIGIKDSSGETASFKAFMEAAGGRSDFSVLVGSDTLMADAVMMGGHGGVNGGANLFPELYVRLYQAAVAKDAAALNVLQPGVCELVRTLFGPETHPAGVIKAIKLGLECLGVCQSTMAQPFSAASPERSERVRSVIDRLRHELPLD